MLLDYRVGHSWKTFFRLSFPLQLRTTDVYIHKHTVYCTAQLSTCGSPLQMVDLVNPKLNEQGYLCQKLTLVWGDELNKSPKVRFTDSTQSFI